MVKCSKLFKKIVMTTALGSVVLSSVVSAAPYGKNETYVPLRNALESNGAVLTWDQATKTVNFTLKNGLAGSVQIGASEYQLGGDKAKLPGEVGLVNNTTYVPLSLIDVLNDNNIAKVQLHAQGLQYEVVVSHGDKLMDGKTYADNNDLSAYVPINGSEEGWLVVAHELNPGGASSFRVKKGADGFYDIVDSKKVNFDAVGGTWNNCSGNITPWGTVLSGEERVPADAKDKSLLDAKAKAEAAGEVFSGDPNNFGLIVEINPATGEVKKHRSMGQFKHEAAIVLEDRKTAYLTDDTGGGIFAKFVANKAEDLSSGTLYAAKWDSKTNKITWIALTEEDLTKTTGKAVAKGATPFDRPEDIEYNPVDGMIYWVTTDSTTLHPENKNKGNFGTIWQYNPKTDEMKIWLEGSADTFANSDGVAIDPVTGDIYVHEDNYDENMLPTIGQDNNAVWKVSLKDKSVTKIASVPYAAEITGGFFTPDGKVLFINSQHPASPNKDQLLQIKGFNK